MAIDLQILRILKYRNEFYKVINRVPTESIEKTTATLLKDFGKYFEKFPKQERLDMQTFATLFSSWHPKLGDDHKNAYASILKRVNDDVPEEEAAVVMQSLLELRMSADMTSLLMRFEEGDVENIHGELDTIVTNFKRDAKVKGLDFVRVDVDDILNQEINDEGLRWRLACLNANMRGLRPGDFGIVAGRPDKGKCLAPDTPVRMHPSGIKLAKDIVNGDQVMGPDGHPRNVTGVTSGTDEMHRVTYPWGESYTVNSAHVLHLDVRGKRVNMPVSEYLTKSATWQARARGVKAGVDYPEKSLGMDPYILGLGLGAGTTWTPRSTPELEIAKALQAEYTQTNEWPGQSGSDVTYACWVRMLKDLHRMDVLSNKHIPTEYLTASRQQRLELLAGIIDNAGHVGDNYEIVTELDVLKDGYLELARSLGFHATAKRTDGYWRVRVGAEAYGEVPVKLSRKVGELRTLKRTGLHFGFTVEPAGVGPYNGFCLDGDHLFLLGDFTVTHNTTFLASEITALAAQTDRPIVWLNNEGPGSRITARLWQAALGVSMTQLIQQHKAGTMLSNYEAAIKGDQHKIRIFDVHGMDTYAVERIIEQNNPALVVYDMIDNVRGFANAGRTDERLEQMYSWARELCVKYDTAGLATSQISVDGADMQFPADHMLKDSRTGKQGACDFILMIGAVDDPGYTKARFIGLPKNKLRREGSAGDPRACVAYRPEIARYEDLPEMLDD